MAYARLSGVYANNARSAEAPAFARKAFELRDRVSERERFFISWRYYLDAEQAWDKALDVALSWTATYPREAFAFNSLGLASAAIGQHDEAVRAFREAIRLESRLVPPHGNLAGSLIASGRFDEARGVLRAAAAQGVDVITLRRMGYALAVIDGDRAAQARELDQVRAVDSGFWAALWEARASAFAGRVARGARALPARHPDGGPRRHARDCRAVGRRRRRDPRDCRPVRRRPARGRAPRWHRAATTSRWSGRAACSRCADKRRSRSG